MNAGGWSHDQVSQNHYFFSSWTEFKMVVSIIFLNITWHQLLSTRVWYEKCSPIYIQHHKNQPTISHLTCKTLNTCWDQAEDHIIIRLVFGGHNCGLYKNCLQDISFNIPWWREFVSYDSIYWTGEGEKELYSSIFINARDTAIKNNIFFSRLLE